MANDNDHNNSDDNLASTDFLNQIPKTIKEDESPEKNKINLPTGQSINATEKIFGRYNLQKKLGSGGMGVVYRALDTLLNKTVALKMMLPDTEEGQHSRFILEASAIAKLDHPNIIRFYEIGEDPCPYFTMDHIEGGTLQELIADRKITPSQLVNFMIKICDALAHAHSQNILHRDIKPSNIMITKENEPVIMDFGLAKFFDNEEQLSQSGEIIGTILYMAPEQTDGVPVPQSDIYSIGATVYEALVHRPLFQGNNRLNLVYRILTEYPIPLRELNPDISPCLEAICLKCVQKKVKHRYKDFTELKSDLENYQNNRPIIARQYTWLDGASHFISKHKFACSLAAFIFIILLVSSISITYSYNLLKEEKEKVEELRGIAVAERDEIREINSERKSLIDALSNSLNWVMRHEKYGEVIFESDFRQPLSSLFSNSDGLCAAQEYELLRGIVFEHKKSKENLNILAKNLTKALVKKPQSAHIYSERGNVYIDLGKYDEALADFKKSIEFDPEKAEVYSHRGRLYYLRKEYDEALKDFNKALSLDANYAEAHTERGFLYFHQKKYDLALKDFNKAIKIDPEYSKAYHKRGLLFDKHPDWENGQALKDYAKAISLHPQLPRPYIERGFLYYQHKDHKKALRDFNKAIQLHMHNARVYYTKGIILFRHKKYKGAWKAYTKAIGLDGHNSNFYYARGNLHARQKRYKLAINDYDKAIDINSEDAKIYNNRGRAHFLQKNYKQAIKDWERAIYLGIARSELEKDIKRAKKYLNK